MKRLLTLSLVLILMMGLFSGAALAEKDVETVQYYCSIGAYLIKLQEEVGDVGDEVLAWNHAEK
mgnify:CR=1 FL=1